MIYFILHQNNLRFFGKGIGGRLTELSGPKVWISAVLKIGFSSLQSISCYLNLVKGKVY